MTKGGFGGQIVLLPGVRVRAQVVVLDAQPWIKVTQGAQTVGYFSDVASLAAVVDLSRVDLDAPFQTCMEES